MKHPFLIMLLASSTVFSIEKPSRFKALKQKLFGKYLITKARENNCPQVASLLLELKNCTGTWLPVLQISNFVTKSSYEAVLRQDSAIEDIIRGIHLYKQNGPSNECNFEGLLVTIKTKRLWLKTQNDPNRPCNDSAIRSQIKSEERNIEKRFGKFSLEELLQKAEEKITAARSALAAAAEKEATTE